MTAEERARVNNEIPKHLHLEFHANLVNQIPDWGSCIGTLTARLDEAGKVVWQATLRTMVKGEWSSSPSEALASLAEIVLREKVGWVQ